MKVFKNPITGETFEDISVAKRAYCLTHLCTLGGCKFYEATNGGLCSEWAAAHPEEAAELMGLVAEETEAISAPRLAEVLGVETGKPFYIKISDETRGPYEVSKDAGMIYQKGCMITAHILQYAINHPESIIRAPRLTEAEIAIMRSLGAKWARWEGGTSLTVLYETEENDPIAYVDHSLFPSLKQGEEIRLEEAEK